MAKVSQDKSGRISVLYFISYIIIGMILAIIYSIIVVYILTPTVYRSVPALDNIDQAIFPLLLVWIGTFFAAKVVRNKYTVDNSGHVAALSTVYVIIFTLLFLIPSLLVSRINGIEIKRNLTLNILSSVLEVLLFYYFSTVYLREKKINSEK